MGRRPPRLSEEDQAAWSHLSRSVRPLRRRVAPRAEPCAEPEFSPLPVPVPVPAPPPRAARRAPPEKAPSQSNRSLPLAVGAAPAGLDAASWQRFRAGRMAAQRRLDLHAHTAQAAFSALDRFVREAQADGLRCVEVITGRGRDGDGLLRREVPLWLNGPALRPLLLAVAHPHVANDGALRLLLRRTRR